MCRHMCEARTGRDVRRYDFRHVQSCTYRNVAPRDMSAGVCVCICAGMCVDSRQEKRRGEQPLVHTQVCTRGCLHKLFAHACLYTCRHICLSTCRYTCLDMSVHLGFHKGGENEFRARACLTHLHTNMCACTCLHPSTRMSAISNTQRSSSPLHA